MKSLLEIIDKFKGNEKILGDACVDELIGKGYTYNPNYGWEKMEVLKKFNLNADMLGIPSILVDELERETSYEDEKDEFTGRKTGRKVSKYKEKTTGRKIVVPTQDWLNYLEYKKQLDETNQKVDALNAASMI